VSDNTIAPFLRNGWYVAAWPEEIGEAPLGRVIMNEPIVLFRDAEGRVAALEDRCCHRGAPLTHGRIVPGGIECGYHGLVYDGTGRCVEIPGQDRIAEDTRVRAFPVVERQQFIWIWMGDPARADESAIIDWPYHDQPDRWPYRRAMFPIAANYMMMIDNLMDLSHLGYVHGRTIGGSPRVHSTADMKVERTATGAMLIREMHDMPPPPSFIKAVNFQGNIDRRQEFEYVAPAAVLQWAGAVDTGKDVQDESDPGAFRIRLFHGATPETETSFHYFWSVSTGYRTDDPQAVEDFYNEVYPTFLEDKAIMEGQQARIAREPGRPLVAIRADNAVVAARRHLQKLLDAESAVREAAE
jgi:vanillate O-demethylase monooxygenase subunit